MGKDAVVRVELRPIIDTALRGVLTEAQATRANDLGRGATNAVMLAAGAHIVVLHAKIAPGTRAGQTLATLGRRGDPIRLAVSLRKNSRCTRSQKGAATQAVLMSIHRTLKLRGHDLGAAIHHALRALSATGTLPPLPLVVAGGGRVRSIAGRAFESPPGRFLGISTGPKVWWGRAGLAHAGYSGPT